MTEFDPELFTRLREPWRLREHALVDLKSQIPKISDPEVLAEYIRDMIAFANVARRRGQCAYILYGVDDNGNILLNGIKGQSTRPELPADWDDEDTGKFERQQNNIIARDLHSQIKKYVQPDMEFDYVPGRVGGILVSYIVIHPSHYTSPFEIKAELKDRKQGGVLLRKGDCWIRKGESKHSVRPEEKKGLYSYREVPYIPETKWGQHLANIARESEDQDWEREIYIPLSCETQGELFRLDLRIEEFLSNQVERVLLLIGRPGTGKTTFLKLLIQRVASETQQSLETSMLEQPPGWIPVFFDLNSYTPRDENNFIRDLSLELDCHSLLRLSTSNSPERIFNDSSLRFLMVLDSFDEDEDIGSGSRKSMVLRDMLRSYTHLKVIIASRPTAVPEAWLRQYAVASILPPSDLDVFSYLSSRLQKPDTLFNFLSDDQDLLRLTRTPLMLEIAADYWEPLDKEEVIKDESIEAKRGLFLHFLFSRLFEHEKRKRLPRDRDLRVIMQRESVSDLALWMDGRHKTVGFDQARRFVGETWLELQNLGVLELEEDKLRFHNDLAQAYFAALALDRFLRTHHFGQIRALSKLNRNHSFWHRCLGILEDLTSADIELLTWISSLISTPTVSRRKET